MNLDDIVVVNFRECLRSYQRSIMWTITASFFFLLFAFDLSKGGEVRVGWTFVSIWGAWGLALLAYLVFSWHAKSCLDRAAEALTYFSNQDNHREELCKFPSLATHPNVIARFGSVAISPIFLFAGLFVRLSYEGSLDSLWVWGGLLFFAVLFAWIPICIASQVWRPFSLSTKPDQENSTDAKKRCG